MESETSSSNVFKLRGQNAASVASVPGSCAMLYRALALAALVWQSFIEMIFPHSPVDAVAIYPTRASTTAPTAQKIRERLGGSRNIFDRFPDRPRYMHQRTYLRLRRLGMAAEAAAMGLMAKAMNMSADDGH